MLLPQSKKSSWNIFFKIIFFAIEFAIFVKTFCFVQNNNYILPKLFFYFQFIFFFAEFVYFNTSAELESSSYGKDLIICPSDEVIFNFIISIKLLFSVLSNFCSSSFTFIVFFYFFVWKISFIIRIEKLALYTITEPFYNQKIDLYFLSSHIINSIVLTVFFHLQFGLLLIPFIIEVFITFPCLLVKKEPKFVPLQFPIKLLDIIKSRYKNNNISLFSAFLFFSFSFLVTNNPNKTSFIIIAIMFFVFLVLDINHLYVSKVSFISYYKSSFLKIFIYLLWCFLYLKKSFFNFNTFDKSAFITVLSSVLVFNLGAFFILLQFNYQKYSSAYLIRKLLNPFIIIISILSPALFIFCILFFNSEFFNSNSYFSYTAFIISVFSAVLLLLYFSIISESWFLLNILLETSNYDDFADHRESVFQLSESKIEAIQGIISADIKNGNLNVLRTDFLALADWTKLNIKNIRYQSRLYIHEIDNRFKNFYRSLEKLILLKKDTALEELFFDIFMRRCLFDIYYENFNDYKILYDVMFDFIKEEIGNNEIQAKSNFRALLSRSPYILQGIKDIYSRIDFEEHVLRKIEEIYDYAIKNDKGFFLSRLTCLADVFLSYHARQDELLIEITERHVDIFNCLRGVLHKIIESSTLKNRYIKIASEELEEINEVFLKMDYNNINVAHIWDYQLFTCEQLVRKAMQINFLESHIVFAPFFKILYGSDGKLFYNALLLFTKLIDDYFSFLRKNKKNDYILKFWASINNFVEFYKYNPVEESLIKSFTNVLVQKYSILKDYPKVSKQAWGKFTRIEDFNYEILDIRKENSSPNNTEN